MENKYNKPYFSKDQNRYLDNTKVFADHWWLKDMMQPAMLQTSELSKINQRYGDFKMSTKDVLIIGTELQNYNLFCEMLENYGWQIKDSWQRDLEEKHLRWYKENNNNPLIINLL